MFDVEQTEEFADWLSGLSDNRAQARISMRIARLQSGLMGDVKSVGEGIRELRIDYGPGYRVYFVQRGKVLVLLLCGGNKSTQDKDIAHAKVLARELEE